MLIMMIMMIMMTTTTADEDDRSYALGRVLMAIFFFRYGNSSRHRDWLADAQPAKEVSAQIAHIHIIIIMDGHGHGRWISVDAAQPTGVPDIPKILLSRHFRRIFLRQIFPTHSFLRQIFRPLFFSQDLPSPTLPAIFAVPFLANILASRHIIRHTHTMGAVGRWQPPLVTMIATSYRQKQHYNSSSTAVEDVATYGYGTTVRQDDAAAADGR
jgi:hypothetical protein